MPFADHILEAVATEPDKAQLGAITKLAEFIVDSECFVFGDETFEALHDLSGCKPSSLLDAVPMCRLPFDRCWFEWNPRCLGRGDENGKITPRKFGILMEALDETMQRVGIGFAWEQDPIKDGHANIIVCPMGYIANWAGGDWRAFHSNIHVDENEQYSKLSDAEKYAARSMLSMLSFVIAPMYRETIERLNRSGHKDVIENFLMTSKGDIDGEYRTAMAALCLLNSKNCVDVKPADVSKINRQRLRRGVPPKVSYKSVDIKLSARDARVAHGAGLTPAEIRKHIVRGHFKIRRSGVYWWRPHIRGNADLGEVRRTSYKVKA